MTRQPSRMTRTHASVTRATRSHTRGWPSRTGPSTHLHGVCVCTAPEHHRGSCVTCGGDL